MERGQGCNVGEHDEQGLGLVCDVKVCLDWCHACATAGHWSSGEHSPAPTCHHHPKTVTKTTEKLSGQTNKYGSRVLSWLSSKMLNMIHP